MPFRRLYLHARYLYAVLRSEAFPSKNYCAKIPEDPRICLRNIREYGRGNIKMKFKELVYAYVVYINLNQKVNQWRTLVNSIRSFGLKKMGKN
jgi:hypothetical protein